MSIVALFERLTEGFYRDSRDRARQNLLALAQSYESSQPSYAADLRAAAERPSDAPISVAAVRRAGGQRTWARTPGVSAG